MLKRVLVGGLVFAVVFTFAPRLFISKTDSTANNTMGIKSQDLKSQKTKNVSKEVVKLEKDEVEADEFNSDSEKRVSFMGVGDNLIHDSIYNDAKKPDGTYDFKPIFEDVKDVIQSKDISYIDQESMIAGDQFGISTYPAFNTPEDMASDVKELGFDFVNIANNHILDKGSKAVVNTSKIWKDLDMEFDGAFATEEDSKKIPVMEKNGVKIAMLCYTYGTNGIKPDTDWRVRYFDDEKIKKDIKKAKEVSDFVLVSAHWGDENVIGKSEFQKHYAKLFNDLGVDVVLGTHPHVIGPVEELKNDKGEKTLVIYSTGNYISAMYGRDNMLGYTATFDFVKKGSNKQIENINMLPTVTYFEQSASGIWSNFKIYKLENYTSDMAYKHLIGKHKNVSMSPEYFENLFNETVDEKYR